MAHAGRGGRATAQAWDVAFSREGDRVAACFDNGAVAVFSVDKDSVGAGSQGVTVKEAAAAAAASAGGGAGSS